MVPEIGALLATLLLAIAGTVEGFRKYLGGIPGVIALLIATTAVSVYLKYQANIQAKRDRERFDGLLRSSRPKPYFFGLLNEAFDEVIMKRIRSEDNEAPHLLVMGRYLIADGEACAWFIVNENDELLGFWCLSADEISEFQTKIGDQAALHKAMALELLTPWTEDERLIRKVSNCIEAWLHTQYELVVKTTHIRWLLQGERRVVVSVKLQNDFDFTGTLTIQSELESELRRRPPNDCALRVASAIDSLMGNFVDLGQIQKGGRPNISALIQRLTT
jgi:hypothetical protein